MTVSLLQYKPKSKILERNYINVYSKLNDKERRQLSYKLRFKEENPSWDETLVYLSKIFASLCKQDATVLDAGCGNGNYVIDENRSRIGWAVGVDVSKEVTSKNICLDEIRFSNLEKLPFEDGTFDIVLSLWVLEHLENPKTVLEEIARVLKPQGYFLFATPNSQYIPLKIMDILKQGSLNSFLNKRLFGREEKEIFPTFYRANTIEELTRAVKPVFGIKELRLNSDVSYLSFNEISYLLSKIILKLPTPCAPLTHPHIIGVLSKSE